MEHWHDQFQRTGPGAVQTGAAGAPEVPAAPVISQDAQDAVATCAPCAAGDEVYGGGAFGAPFHALESRDPETGCLFIECPLQRDRWLAEQRMREIALELYEALRSLAALVGQLSENAQGTVQGDDLNRAYGAACNVLAKATE